MKLEQTIQTMESRLWEWGRRLFKGRNGLLREALESTLAALQSDCAELSECRADLAQARLTLKSLETRAALLSSHIEAFVHVHDGARAYEHALELDSLREQIAIGRQGLRQLLQEERELLDRARGRHARLETLQAKLVTP